jgi:DNA polymerase-2
MYVDCLFVQQAGFQRPVDFDPLMNAIQERTGVPIALDGVFKWVAFLSSKRDPRIPVPNQYFGVFQDGTIKYRGIELRRRDTTLWVRKIQLAGFHILARAATPREIPKLVPEVLALAELAKSDLKAGRVPHEELVVKQRVSRALNGYRSASPAARAAMQLQAVGRETAPGQSVKFLFTRGGSGVHAWDLGEPLGPGRLNTKRYCVLLDRAMRTLLDPCKPFCIPERLF